MRKVLTRTQVDADPNTVWNTFVELLAITEPFLLEGQQRPAHFVFSYDAEVNNGGHFQFFVNHGTSTVTETIQALRQLGAGSQAGVLSDARVAFDRIQVLPISDAISYLKAEEQAGLSAFDDLFADCMPNLMTILEQHLREHVDWYINIVEE